MKKKTTTNSNPTTKQTQNNLSLITFCVGTTPTPTVTPSPTISPTPTLTPTDADARSITTTLDLNWAISLFMALGPD